jgi:hypothetical protein
MKSFFHLRTSAITEPFHKIVLSFGNFGYHEAFSRYHSTYLEILDTHNLGESSFHI